MSANGSKSAKVRAKLNHPIIDTDGHTVEFTPVFFDYIKEAGGAAMIERYKRAVGSRANNRWAELSEEERRYTRATCPPWWARPAKNTTDRATASLPHLLYQRMDELGLDFAVLRTLDFRAPAHPARADDTAAQPSALRQWPVQLHLLSPAAPYFRDADVLLAADCVAFAAGDFHRDFLAGRALAIACPKLDSQQDAYVAKLAALIDGAAIRSLTVAIMEVPCCGGLVRLAQAAAARAGRPVPLRVVVVGVQGQVLAEQELAPARPIAPPRASLPSLG